MVIAYERRAVKEIVELKYFQILWVVLRSSKYIYHAHARITHWTFKIQHAAKMITGYLLTMK